MTRPALTDWDPPIGEIAEPNGSQKSAGFLVADEPPSKWFNWFWKNASDWFTFTNSEVGNNGTFTPVFLDAVLTENTKYGRWTIVGDMCYCVIQTAWENTDAGLDATPLKLQLPYQHLQINGQAAQGTVNNVGSSFGAQDTLEENWYSQLSLTAIPSAGQLLIKGSTGATGGSTTLDYGGDVNSISVEIWYPHNGIGNYGAETPNRVTF